jgi:hypothetical protein
MGAPAPPAWVQVDEGEILEGEVAHHATQPKKPIGELPGQVLRRWRVIDALVPNLQVGGDAERPEEHHRGPDDAQGRHCVTSRGHELVDGSGRLLIETEAGDEDLSHVTSTLGRNNDHEGEQAQDCERGELQGAVHEGNGVEPGPEGSRRGGPCPIDYAGPLIQQPPLLIAERLALRGSYPGWAWRQRDSSLLVNLFLRLAVRPFVFAHGHDLLRALRETLSSWL